MATFIDVCATEELADFRIAEHQSLGRKSVAKFKTKDPVVTNVKGQSSDDIKVRLAPRGEMWVVWAEDRD